MRVVVDDYLNQLAVGEAGQQCYFDARGSGEGAIWVFRSRRTDKCVLLGCGLSETEAEAGLTKMEAGQ